MEENSLAAVDLPRTVTTRNELTTTADSQYRTRRPGWSRGQVREQITLVLTKFHWLPVRRRSHFKLACSICPTPVADYGRVQ